MDYLYWMNKEILQALVDRGLSTYDIADEIKKSQTTVRYYLDKFNLKTNKERRGIVKYPVVDGKKTCSSCGEIKLVSEFYKINKGSNVRQNVCKNCSNQSAIRKMIDTKLRMIEYKGGKCVKCGLELRNSHYSVFDFHHTDPSNKDKSLREMRTCSWERIVDELDKCNLLCSNCHRMEHARLKGPVV